MAKKPYQVDMYCIRCDDEKVMDFVSYRYNKYSTLIRYFQCEGCDTIASERQLESELEEKVSEE